LYRIQPVIYKVGRRALNSLARSATKRIIGKGCTESGVADSRQLVPYVPRIRGRHPGIGDGSQVAVQIVCLSVRAEDGLLVIGVVAHGRERRGQPTPGERSTGLDPIPRRIVGVEQRAQGRRAFLIRQAREFRRRIVGVGDTVRIGEGERGSAIRVVIPNRDRARPLLHLGQTIRVVVGKTIYSLGSSFPE